VRRRLVLAMFVVLACGPELKREPVQLEQPIIGGTADTGDPAVVLLGGGGVWSTGTVVSPHVVLTCGHCVEATRSFAYFGSSYLQDPMQTIVAVTTYYPYPTFSPANFRNADIGIVVLASAAPVAPVPFDVLPLDVGLIDAGTPMRMVGFGADGNPNDFAVKMQRTQSVIELDAKEIIIGPAICSGDSGGPGFLQLAGGQEVIAGVISWDTPSDCSVEGGLARVDLYSDWIQQQIALHEPDGGTSDAGAVDAGVVDAGAGGGSGGGAAGGGAAGGGAAGGGAATGGGEAAGGGAAGGGGAAMGGGEAAGGGAAGGGAAGGSAAGGSAAGGGLGGGPDADAGAPSMNVSGACGCGTSGWPNAWLFLALLSAARRSTLRLRSRARVRNTGLPRPA
jgi:hypothetical protein